ncbi:MAG TPA: YtxH domain-containing protein [Flavobacterium sp.]|uniref:YtxH domain-containing protein n=1 Tax=Flavobacterium sp. TaxID=239 RepID=UPI002F416C3F
MKTDKVILGVLGGLAAGAILGILFAPEKGEKTRKKIKNKGIDYADELKYQYGATANNLSKKYDSLKQEGKSLLKDGKAKFDSLKGEGEAFLAEGKAKFENTKNEIENLDV